MSGAATNPSEAPRPGKAAGPNEVRRLNRARRLSQAQSKDRQKDDEGVAGRGMESRSEIAT